MKKNYTKTTNDNNDIIYKIIIDDSEPVILVYHNNNNTTSNYKGFRAECFLDGITCFLKRYPNFLLDVENSNQLTSWFKLKGFKKIESLETELILN